MTATITGLLLPADGTTPRLVQTPADDYRAIAKLIGCNYLEHVRTVIPGVVMLVDEEGAIRADGFRVLNLQSSAGRLYPGHIFGDVIVYSESMTDFGLDVVDLQPEDLLTVCSRLGIRHILGLGGETIDAVDEPTEDLGLEPGLHRLIERGEA